MRQVGQQGRRRRLVAFVGLAALGVAAAGCGGDDGEDDVSTGGGATGDGWPLTIEHAFGETTLDEPPERIVTIDVQWTDVLLAMDVEPVGYVVDEALGNDGQFPWHDEQLDGVERVVMGDAVPFERIIELDPDLILATHVVEDQDTYDTLARIASTIPLLEDRGVDPWQEQAEVAGRFLDEPEKAAELVTDVETLMSATAEELPGLEGQTFSLVNYVPGDALWVVSDPADGSTIFFEQLGLELNPNVVDSSDADGGRVQLSFEQVGMLDSDLLILLANDGDPEDLPGYTELPAVTSGAVSEMDLGTVVGLNTPTPLSIPYVLDELLPTLEAAAA